MWHTISDIRLRAIHQIADATIIVCCCSVAYWIRFDELIMAADYRIPALLYIVFTYLCLTLTGHYQHRYSSSIRSSLESILYGIALSALLTTMFLYFTKTGATFSRLWFGYVGIFSVLSISAFRLGASKLLKISTGPTKIVVLGANRIATKIMGKFQSGPHEICAVQRFPNEDIPFDGDVMKAISSAATFVEKMRDNSFADQPISEVWVTHDIYDACDPRLLTGYFLDSAVKLVYVAELPEIRANQPRRVEFIEGFATLNSELSVNNRSSILLKFLLDKIVAAMALLFLLPVFIMIAILIRLDSAGPAFYKQSRYGTNGKEFSIWKFRTMNVLENTSEFKQATAGDPRITRIGKFLRKTSIDELPQLINVLIGDMSLVGPRPHPNLLNEEFRSRLRGYMQRHQVKPGITGLAQIRGYRGETKNKSDMENRMLSDLEYIETWNIFLDIKILFLTLFRAYASGN